MTITSTVQLGPPMGGGPAFDDATRFIEAADHSYGPHTYSTWSDLDGNVRVARILKADQDIA